MSAEPAHDPRQVRLSADYAEASQRVEPTVSAGRLAIDYQLAVAELVNNPSAFCHLVLDERFDGNGPSWPNDPRCEARRVERGYRLTPRLDGDVVAIGAPVGFALRDVVVAATFRKLGGPSGGVYGLFLRNGRNLASRYYAAQLNDRGEVGIWRRDLERWFELVPWTRSPSVRAGEATNDVSFESVGGRLTLVVNGQAAASAHDAVLDQGGIGLLVGGSGNDVLVEQVVAYALD
jgi:hypothetical protein